MAVLARSPVVSSRSSKVEPRSVSVSIMESPTWPSASVMCSPFSVSERVTRCATSLTLSATRSPTEVMSCDRSRWTLADGVAHVLGLVDQGLALVGELAEQVADAHFVVVIGALERGDFVVHQRFQLGRARERALDAVAHGGDFAADGLADRHDLFARGGLRLRQPHRHLGHGLGDQAQVLRTAEHEGEHEEEDHRHGDGADEADPGGKAAARGPRTEACNSPRKR